MICPKCGSEDVNVQIVTEQKLVKEKKSLIYWLLIGWWFVPTIWFIKWFFFTVPALFCKILGIGGKKKQIKTIKKTVAVCQKCGNSWEVKE